MSEREILARLIAEAVVGTWTDQTLHADKVADRIIAAGWMRRPEPGSPAWNEMVERANAAMLDSHGGWIGSSWDMAEAAIRAALQTGEIATVPRKDRPTLLRLVREGGVSFSHLAAPEARSVRRLIRSGHAKRVVFTAFPTDLGRAVAEAIRAERGDG